MRAEAAPERFITDKALIASILNGFKNDPFYIHLVSWFTKEFSMYKRRKSGQKFCKNPRVFYHI